MTRYENGLVPNTQEDRLRNAYLDALKSGATYSNRLQVQRDDVLDILKHQQQVIHTLKSAEVACHGDQTQSVLAEAFSSMGQIQAFLCQALKFDPLKTQPSDRSRVVAEKVFAIPELAEMIILEVGPYGILQAMQTCKALSYTITSPKLQIKLSLREQCDGYWYSPFARDILGYERGSARDETKLHDFLICDIIVPRRRLGHAAETGVATVRAAFAHPASSYGRGGGVKKLPTIGSRGLSMLICQPPITEMTINVSCCDTHRARARQDKGRKIFKAEGLTVGDLLCATVKARKKREQCPYAEEFEHDHETGSVLVHVSFEGSMQLRSDDPCFADEYEAGESRAAEYRSRSEDEYEESYARGRLREYINYKKQAYQKGQTILTMAKFFATASKRSQT
ncbi:hypothetical protein LTR56_023961 [Elasticomyces elasticus]|nr:hypothetical protein LTR56_023961 [Elasticomyces elasticus]KAK3634648.1 hypothetical protein LTR22_019541 [Elasticomyces elasticus]KAK4911336.1 hypothetical protein LTR49_020073 [Elasticomyces elasticus]KAK5758199.1 hypothetical protein LTS12_011669 [Elasticomyces elasticus]